MRDGGPPGLDGASAPRKGQVLCALDEIAPGSAKSFGFGAGRARLEIFLVRPLDARADEVYGYVNRCPHKGTPLNWIGDRFLDVDRRFIQCATHGALFGIKDGACRAGPCPGARLRTVTLGLEDGIVTLEAIEEG